VRHQKDKDVTQFTVATEKGGDKTKFKGVKENNGKG
jgi:hypothetical protein